MSPSMLDPGRLDTIDLATLQEHAPLQTRFDAKYLVRTDIVQEVLDARADELVVLEHEGVRGTEYETRYFDTPDLVSYRDHSQGRRRRFKVRTRHYGRPAEGYLELKLKSTRAMTSKVRWRRHTDTIGEHLGATDTALVAGELDAHYGLTVTGPWLCTLETRFVRTTLLHLGSRDRLTIDERVVLSHEDRYVHLHPGRAIVEVKSRGAASTMGKVLVSHGQRPEPMSKYCVGVAALHRGVRTNVWREQLRLLAG